MPGKGKDHLIAHICRSGDDIHQKWINSILHNPWIKLLKQKHAAQFQPSLIQPLSEYGTISHAQTHKVISTAPITLFIYCTKRVNRGPLGQGSRCPMFTVKTFSLAFKQQTGCLIAGLPDWSPHLLTSCFTAYNWNEIKYINANYVHRVMAFSQTKPDLKKKKKEKCDFIYLGSHFLGAIFRFVVSWPIHDLKSEQK